MAFYFIFGDKKAIEEINVGAGKPVGKMLIPLVKYGFTIITIVVVVLGVIYGGIG